jgi:hypothetical protein
VSAFDWSSARKEAKSDLSGRQETVEIRSVTPVLQIKWKIAILRQWSSRRNLKSQKNERACLAFESAQPCEDICRGSPVDTLAPPINAEDA